MFICNMADARDSNNELDHPEVLSRERLMEILCERFLDPKELLDLEKSDLVQLFYKYVSPLPQRLHQLRRGKRAIPCRRHLDTRLEATTKGKNSKRIRLTKRSSSDSNSNVTSKMAKLEPERIENDKKPASLEIVNHGMSSVSIKSPSQTTKNKNCHVGTVLDVKPKVVKLNRSTLGLNLSKTVEDVITKAKSVASSDSENQRTAQDIVSQEKQNNKSNEINGGDNSTRPKFKKVAVTWP